MGKIDIYEVLSQCKKGELEAYVQNGSVYLEDKETGDRVKLAPLGVGWERDGRPAVMRQRSRTENLFGPRENWGQNREQEQGQGPYRGFLLIECERCGKTHAYCARQETFVSRCDCGHETVLENLLIMHMHCKCGKDFRYRTNLRAQRVTHECLDCKAPVDMELNGRGTAYVTIGRRK